MATPDNERYLRHVWLLGEGGLFVLRLVVKREAAKSGHTLGQLLTNKKASFHNILNEQRNILFPTSTTVNADVETWDISLLLLVLKRLFWPGLTLADRSCITLLKTYRNDIQGHPTKIDMNGSDYFSNRNLLEQSLRSLSASVNATIEINDIISKTASGNIDIQNALKNIKEIHEYKDSMLCALETKFERIFTKLSDMDHQSKEEMADIKETVTQLVEVTDSTNRRIENIERAVKGILQLKQMIVQKEKHRTTEELQTIIQAECEDKEKQKAATDLLFSLVKVIQVDRTFKDEEIKEMITQRIAWYGELALQLIDDIINWFSDMNALPDAFPCNAQLGSILIPISCTNVSGLLMFLKYMTSNQCKLRLSNISSTLGTLLGFPCTLLWKIESMDLQKSLSSHLKQMESKKVVLPFHTASIEGLTQVINMFEGEERNSHIKNISETLSKIFGENIQLRAFVDKIHFKETHREKEKDRSNNECVVANLNDKKASKVLKRSKSEERKDMSGNDNADPSGNKLKGVTRSLSFGALKAQQRKFSGILKEILRLKQRIFEKHKEDKLFKRKEVEAYSIETLVIPEEPFPDANLGIIELHTSTENKTISAVEENKPLVPKGMHSIQFDDNNSKISVSGMDLLPDVGFLVIDINKQNLYKLNFSYKVLDICNLPGNPCDVRYIGEGRAAVCIDYRKVLIVHVIEDMTCGESFDICGLCAGLACYDNIIYIGDTKGSVYTRTLDNPTLLNVLYKSKEAYETQPQRTSIAVSNDGKMIYRKCGKELLTLDHEGNVVSNMKVDAIFKISDVCVLENTIILCDIFMTSLMQIDRVGKRVLRTIPIFSEATNSPSLMCFNQQQSLLLLVETSGKIKEFKISD